MVYISSIQKKLAPIIILLTKKKHIVIKNSKHEIVKDNIKSIGEIELIGLPYDNYTFETWVKRLFRKKESLISFKSISHTKISESNYNIMQSYASDSRRYYYGSKNPELVGKYGEWLLESHIIKSCYNRYYKILHNVYVPIGSKGNTTEIDTLLIDKTGIYVIESKNYSGWIYGSENNDNWTQTLYSYREHKSKKNYFYNPIKQNEGHIKALASKIHINERFFKSYIIFSDHCCLKNSYQNNKNYNVFKLQDLSTILGFDLERNNVFDDEQIDNIFDMLSYYTNQSSLVKAKHISDINALHKN